MAPPSPRRVLPGIIQLVNRLLVTLHAGAPLFAGVFGLGYLRLAHSDVPADGAYSDRELIVREGIIVRFSDPKAQASNFFGAPPLPAYWAYALSGGRWSAIELGSAKAEQLCSSGGSVGNYKSAKCFHERLETGPLPLPRLVAGSLKRGGYALTDTLAAERNAVQRYSDNSYWPIFTTPVRILLFERNDRGSPGYRYRGELSLPPTNDGCGFERLALSADFLVVAGCSNLHVFSLR